MQSFGPMTEIMTCLTKKIIKHYNEDLILKHQKIKSFIFFKCKKSKQKEYIYILLKYQILLTFLFKIPETQFLCFSPWFYMESQTSKHKFKYEKNIIMCMVQVA